jgi:hypothetical protein
MSAIRAAQAGSVYFAVVFGAGFALGLVRVPLLVPRIGVRWAELLEMPFMLIVIVLAARFVTRRFALSAARPAALLAGLIALALLVTAELALALLLSGASPAAYIEGRDAVSGPVYGAMLMVFALLPWLLARRRGSRLPFRDD